MGCRRALRGRAADLEVELARAKGERDELRAEHQRALEDGRRREAELAAYKADLEDASHRREADTEAYKAEFEDASRRREAEAEAYKAKLDDASLRREKDAAAYKGELDNVLDEHDKQARRNEKLTAEGATQTRRHNSLAAELAGALEDLVRASSQRQRAEAERDRFEAEHEATSQQRDDVRREYDDLVKKLDAIQEERTLEGRYTEALVNQRDNMNAIIETGRAEIGELKRALEEQRATHRGYRRPPGRVCPVVRRPTR